MEVRTGERGCAVARADRLSFKDVARRGQVPTPEYEGRRVARAVNGNARLPLTGPAPSLSADLRHRVNSDVDAVERPVGRGNRAAGGRCTARVEGSKEQIAALRPTLKIAANGKGVRIPRRREAAHIQPERNDLSLGVIGVARAQVTSCPVPGRERLPLLELDVTRKGRIRERRLRDEPRRLTAGGHGELHVDVVLIGHKLVVGNVAGLVSRRSQHRVVVEPGILMQHQSHDLARFPARPREGDGLARAVIWFVRFDGRQPLRRRHQHHLPVPRAAPRGDRRARRGLGRLHTERCHGGVRELGAAVVQNRYPRRRQRVHAIVDLRHRIGAHRQAREPREPRIALRSNLRMVTEDYEPRRRRRVGTPSPDSQVADELVLQVPALGALIRSPRPDDQPTLERKAQSVRDPAVAEQLIWLGNGIVGEGGNDEDRIGTEIGGREVDRPSSPVVAAIDAVREGTVRSRQRADDVVTSDAVDRYRAVDEGFLRGHSHRVHRDAQRRH